VTTLNPEVTAPRVVLSATRWCAVRQHKGGYLVFNTKTEELHFMSEECYDIFGLCDGSLTAEEIARYLDSGTPGLHDDLSQTRNLIEMFVARGLVEGHYAAS
jgi:hypothetical protein